MAFQEKRFARIRHFSAMTSRSLSSKSTIASAHVEASPLRAHPECSSMTSEIAPLERQITGVPHDKDSSAANPNVSIGPGAKNMEASAICRARSLLLLRKPRKEIPNLSFLALASNFDFSGPSPAIQSGISTPRAFNSRATSRRRNGSFSGDSLVQAKRNDSSISTLHVAPTLSL